MIGAIRRTFRELAWLEALLYYLSEVMLRVSGRHARLFRYCLVAQPVADGPLVSRPDPNTEIRRIYPGDPLIVDFPRAPEIIAMRLARGDVCLCATVKGRFAGFMWLVFGAYDEDEVRCRYELSGQALCWDYDMHIEPEFRMGRSFLRLWDAANALLREREVWWSISRISAFNPVSLNSHARLGTRMLGKVTFFVLGSLQVSFTGQLIPHFSVSDKSPPILQLRAPEKNQA